VDGIFFDQMPVSPFSIGPVAMAVRAARRAGLGPLVLKPIGHPDPLYRVLDATICAPLPAPPAHWPVDRLISRPAAGHAVAVGSAGTSTTTGS
jgi:hypothetical protein